MVPRAWVCAVIMIRAAIIAAMAGELKPLVRGWHHETRNRVDLWRWRFDTGEWIAACAGAGQNAATRALAEVERDGPVATVISIGWAGALSEAYERGHAYRVSSVVDTLTGERFRAARISGSLEAQPPIPALEGYGFSRAEKTPPKGAASAAEERLAERRATPPGLKPQNISASAEGTAEAVPFQNQPASMSALPNEIWLATSPKVADAAEKHRLAAAYRAGLVDMEAAAIARLAAMRGIGFHCIKGVSDGLTDRLPDFNRFLTPEGRFQLTRFTLFALFHPGHWPALKQMGENSKKASVNMAESVLDLLDPQGTIRKRNGHPNLDR
jgi:nucleoside phosphorylase